jgi:predicted metal-binding membrane protein
MMLPSLIPMLRRYRAAVGRTGGPELDLLTLRVAASYFFVWTSFGVAVYPLGVALAEMEMRKASLARGVPIAVGIVILAAGCLQLTAWKAHHLRCCREIPGCSQALSADASTAWRYGLRIGGHCCTCCAGLMAILLVMGSMDLRAMAIVAAAVSVERLAPAGERIARALGLVAILVGLLLLARAVGGVDPVLLPEALLDAAGGPVGAGVRRDTFERFGVRGLHDPHVSQD